MRNLIRIKEEEYFPQWEDDPVRPELDKQFRWNYNREVYALKRGEEVDAVLCVAYTNLVPKAVEDLVDPMGEECAVFYTVWSYNKGAGREIVIKTWDFLKENKKEIKRYITLSPKTEMAYKFHTKNGAKLISENEMTDNYEYI